MIKKITLYKQKLYAEEEGLVVQTDKFVSIHETPCFYFCVEDRFVSDTVDNMRVYAIVNTLTEFDEVNSVLFYIDGEKLDILGQLDVRDPVFRRSDLIK